MDNAVKYTPAGSRITISARREGEMVRVEIADDGGGIPDEAKEKLFQMFYTAQHKRGGDGPPRAGAGAFALQIDHNRPRRDDHGAGQPPARHRIFLYTAS